MREELAYVVPLGIPHSHFHGGPNRWTQLDRDKALGWKRDQLTICPGCHTRKEEWDKDRDAYIGNIEHCPGCERIAQERENAQGSNRRGLHIGLVPKEFATTGEELGLGG